MKKPPYDDEDDRPVYRMEPVRVNPCESVNLHGPHERSWWQTDPSGDQEAFIRIDYCPGVGRVV